MNDKDPSSPKRLLPRPKVLSAIGMTAAVAIGAQVGVDHVQRPTEPKIEIVDPLTWVATPLDNAIEASHGSSAQTLESPHAPNIDSSSAQPPIAEPK